MSDELPTPNTSSSDTNATSVGGNVATGRDFVGRDLTIQGDQVQGNKITTGDRGVAAGQIIDSIIVTGNSNIIGDGNTVITQRLDPTDARNQRNHATMRQLVRKFWIDGVLKSSMYNEVLIRLNLTEQPKAVDNRPWDLILQQPGQPNYALPAGTPIIDVFDQMNQRLLILGEPGSGKTTMLLELADALLKRADADPTHPTPVVFNLSSWAEKRQPLVGWLVDELRTKYNISQKLAQKWVRSGELLPLLDGLDEVRQEHRNTCVMAINNFYQEQEYLVPMTVCSRVTEYGDLTVQLKLQGAVLVQPLTLAQVDEYLDKAGGELSTVRVILQQDKELQEMATSPLLLSIIVLAYHGAAMAIVSLSSSTYTRRQHLFDVYIKRMFLHRGYTHSYPVQKTVHWLSWLAENMSQRQQTIFLIERLQPDWLQIRSHYWMYKLGAGLFFGLAYGFLAVLALGLTYGFLFWLVFSFFAGLFAGLNNIEMVEELEFDRYRLFAGLVVGLLVGLGGGLLVGLGGGPGGELFAGLEGGLLFGLSVGLTTGLQVSLKRKDMSQNTYVKQVVWRSTQTMLLIGLSVSLSVGVFFGLSGGLIFGRFFGLLGGVVFGLGAGLIVALNVGGRAFTQHFALRTLFWVYNFAPINYARFLDYCHDRLFLRKVGGGYIFIHRILLEHFASLTDEDIKRIVADVEASRKQNVG